MERLMEAVTDWYLSGALTTQSSAPNVARTRVVSLIWCVRARGYTGCSGRPKRPSSRLLPHRHPPALRLWHRASPRDPQAASSITRRKRPRPRRKRRRRRQRRRHKRLRPRSGRPSDGAFRLLAALPASLSAPVPSLPSSLLLTRTRLYRPAPTPAPAPVPTPAPYYPPVYQHYRTLHTPYQRPTPPQPDKYVSLHLPLISRAPCVR
jgi:hypothetical protein